MQKVHKNKEMQAPDMLDEYDFSDGVRGKYIERLSKGSHIIVLAPDVAEIFPDSDSVNEALRYLTKIIRKREKQLAA